MEAPKRKPESAPAQSVARGSGAAALGMNYGLTILVFTGLGWWLDGHFETSPWLIIVGSLLGAVGAFVSLLKKVPPVAGRPSSKDDPPSSI